MRFLAIIGILACMYGHMMHAVFVRLACLVNDERKKFILCDDMHLDSETKSMIEQHCGHQVAQDACEAQQKTIEHGMTHLLHDLHTKTNIVTETNMEALCTLIQRESRRTQDNNDSLVMVVRYLLRDIMRPKQTKRITDNGQASPSFYDGFAINEHLSWVVGDQRDIQDSNISFRIPFMLQGQIKCEFLTLEEKALFASICIGSVKNYVRGMRAFFNKKGFHDQYGHRVSETLDAITEKSGLSEASHFVHFHIYFTEHEPQNYEAFVLNMIRFVAQKFDLELRDCCNAFMKSDNDCDTTIIATGYEHTTYVQEHLLSKGFHLVDESSKPIQTPEEAKSELYLKSVPERIERCNKLFNELISAL